MEAGLGPENRSGREQERGRGVCGRRDKELTGEQGASGQATCLEVAQGLVQRTTERAPDGTPVPDSGAVTGDVDGEADGELNASSGAYGAHTRTSSTGSSLLAAIADSDLLLTDGAAGTEGVRPPPQQGTAQRPEKMKNVRVWRARGDRPRGAVRQERQQVQHSRRERKSAARRAGKEDKLTRRPTARLLLSARGCSGRERQKRRPMRPICIVIVKPCQN